MRLDSFLKAPKGNNLISKSRAFHNVGETYTKDRSKNELAYLLLIRGRHNKHGRVFLPFGRGDERLMLKIHLENSGRVSVFLYMVSQCIVVDSVFLPI